MASRAPVLVIGGAALALLGLLVFSPVLGAIGCVVWIAGALMLAIAGEL